MPKQQPRPAMMPIQEETQADIAMALTAELTDEEAWEARWTREEWDVWRTTWKDHTIDLDSWSPPPTHPIVIIVKNPI